MRLFVLLCIFVGFTSCFAEAIKMIYMCIVYTYVVVSSVINFTIDIVFICHFKCDRKTPVYLSVWSEQNTESNKIYLHTLHGCDEAYGGVRYFHVYIGIECIVSGGKCVLLFGHRQMDGYIYIWILVHVCIVDVFVFLFVQVNTNEMIISLWCLVLAYIIIIK